MIVLFQGSNAWRAFSASSTTTYTRESLLVVVEKIFKMLMLAPANARPMDAMAPGLFFTKNEMIFFAIIFPYGFKTIFAVSGSLTTKWMIVAEEPSVQQIATMFTFAARSVSHTFASELGTFGMVTLS